jgi:hypothetical protein
MNARVDAIDPNTIELPPKGLISPRQQIDLVDHCLAIVSEKLLERTRSKNGEQSVGIGRIESTKNLDD